MDKAKSIFMDRDGVINDLVYHQEQGIIDSPFTVKQYRLLPGVGQAINKFHNLGYKVILVSNQPGIAKGHISKEIFHQIRDKMERELTTEGAFLDAEYYCFHHPEAIIESLKVNCECRKPKPGMLFEAASEMDIDLYHSWMIGDNLTDIKAGKSAGTQTILLGRMKCELCHLMEEENIWPDAIAKNLEDTIQVILKEEVSYANIR